MPNHVLSMDVKRELESSSFHCLCRSKGETEVFDYSSADGRHYQGGYTAQSMRLDIILRGSLRVFSDDLRMVTVY